MIYKKKTDIEFLRIDEANMVAYDPKSGDAHYISGTGVVVLDLLDSIAEFDAIISRLFQLYEGNEYEIREDVKVFLSELVLKEILIAE